MAGKEDTSIAIKFTTKARLEKLGRMHDTYDLLLNKILDVYENYINK